jgi:allantoinase
MGVSGVSQHRLTRAFTDFPHLDLPSEQFLKRCTDQFDRLYLEGGTNARIMAISIHPYITGVPHRIKYLEALLDYVIGHDGVALMTASQVGDWYRSEMSKS